MSSSSLAEIWFNNGHPVDEEDRWSCGEMRLTNNCTPLCLEEKPSVIGVFFLMFMLFAFLRQHSFHLSEVSVVTISFFFSLVSRL